MHVAVDELAPAVADPDHRAAAERFVGDARGLEPGAVEEAVEITALEPLGTSATRVAVPEARPVPHRRHLAPLCRAKTPFGRLVIDDRLAVAAAQTALTELSSPII